MANDNRPYEETKNMSMIKEVLDKSERGLTIAEIAEKLKLNRHTVAKLCERLLIEKKINYEEKGPAKIFYSLGSTKFVGRIDLGPFEKLWIDVCKKPRYVGEEEFIRINQTKHDSLSRSSSKFKSVGAVVIKKSQLVNFIRILRDIARKEFGLNV